MTYEKPRLDPRPFAWRFLQVPVRILSTVFFDLQVFGVENVPAEGGVILASNHQSYLDPMLLAARLARPLKFLAKKELFEVNSYFTALISSLGAFPVRQGESHRGAMKECLRQLEAGSVLAIFPEGKRTSDGSLLPIEGGVALLVRRAEVPVVPAAIVGSFEAWPRSRRFFRPGYPIRIAYGKPLYLYALPSEQIVEEIGRAIRRLHDSLC